MISLERTETSNSETYAGRPSNLRAESGQGLDQYSGLDGPLQI